MKPPRLKLKVFEYSFKHSPCSVLIDLNLNSYKTGMMGPLLNTDIENHNSMNISKFQNRDCTTTTTTDTASTTTTYHEFNQSSESRMRQNNAKAVRIFTYLVFITLISNIPGTFGIDCFKCVSLNGDNPSCEDPFHNNFSISILESPCMGGRKGRNGLFPATACIKLAGKYYDTGETITVRGCALDSGTLNVDTEIIRMSHCGHFWFDERYVKGCLQSCDDADGCNGARRSINSCYFTPLLALLLLSISMMGGSTGFIQLQAYGYVPKPLPPSQQPPPLPPPNLRTYLWHSSKSSSSSSSSSLSSSTVGIE